MIEPEFRLPVMVTYLAFTAVGFFGWGEALYKADPWPIPVIVCMGLINLGVQLGTTAVVTYVSDCHRVCRSLRHHELYQESFRIWADFLRQRLDRYAGGKRYVLCDWRYDGCSDAVYDSNVYLWEEGEELGQEGWGAG